MVLDWCRFMPSCVFTSPVVRRRGRVFTIPCGLLVAVFPFRVKERSSVFVERNILTCYCEAVPFERSRTGLGVQLM